MLLSRFWYVVLGLLLGVAAFVLFLAAGMYNRVGARAMGEALSSDAQVVSWYLGNDARQRSAQLIAFALEPDVGKFLQKSSDSDAKVPDEARDKVGAALRAVNAKIPPEFAFDAVFAVDTHGRVVAHVGYEQAAGMEDFELGGYPVVADALHGFIRDDTLVLDRIYRVVTRPVEVEAGSMPAGAIVGARIIDDKFARELSSRTGAAVAFYTKGQRVAAGAPEDFDKAQLDQIVSDLANIEGDADYAEKGRSGIRTIGGLGLGVQYTRLPGEAWELGAGYAVGRLPARVDGPLGFFKQADDKDKKGVPVPLVAGIVLGAMALGLIFSIFEHSRPLGIFRREAAKMAKGEVDQLAPSKFRGIYRKIASDLNDGVDKVAAKGGVPRRAADLQQVLGDLPAEPQMSAFSFPGDPAAAPPSGPGSGPISLEPEPVLASQPSSPRLPKPPPRPGGAPPPPRAATPAAAPAAMETTLPSNVEIAASAGAGEAAEWRAVYQDFVALKQQCGENIEGFTYEKFEQTLKKNRDALVQRHGAAKVKFSVYVKDGKAALKASPIKA
ncbi:MAG: hypothetical protein IPM35_29575 [Myxococcales bacterium]|nr:hypothetical protein [Myxococcales bacterium]